MRGSSRVEQGAWSRVPGAGCLEQGAWSRGLQEPSPPLHRASYRNPSPRASRRKQGPSCSTPQHAPKVALTAMCMRMCCPIRITLRACVRLCAVACVCLRVPRTGSLGSAYSHAVALEEGNFKLVVLAAAHAVVLLEKHVVDLHQRREHQSLLLRRKRDPLPRRGDCNHIRRAIAIPSIGGDCNPTA